MKFIFYVVDVTLFTFITISVYDIIMVKLVATLTFSIPLENSHKM